ncbi:TylF/MycF/NovP-related O-methyltransferase [Jejuia pallidilutea]|uniref:Macrocin-O-methyltransferase n=2 Tax=Jejuia pallidilutea TaxID=504487 RepID=A0A090VSB4_9FLAO|nr:TylF/MycF/NovP-related O-methyltransferase [Jejuia pallidilutea]GAL67635.1 macrocin-O-methyltransferase [Jejuia pallidilutea]GAL89450.1 macrocin-O-methyltransferase [Jejuia pallidilutea]
MRKLFQIKSKEESVYEKYKVFTMIPLGTYTDNLLLCDSFNEVDGCIVECGVWRGGMIAGIYEYSQKKRKCILFDSFEGLPDAKLNDGDAAKTWQIDNDGKGLDNCKAEIHFAEKAMALSGSKHHKIVKGWFDKTIPSTKISESIAILRLDGDWYDSTMVCLENLYPLVAENGLIIIDDYYAWDGCSRAVHDYLSKNNLPLRIRQTKNDVCYIIKTSQGRKL